MPPSFQMTAAVEGRVLDREDAQEVEAGPKLESRIDATSDKGIVQRAICPFRI